MLDHNSDRTSLYYSHPKKFSVLPPEIINFFSLHFESIEFEEERMSFSQNKCNSRGKGGVLKNEQGRTRGGGRGDCQES